tara:strand:- start:4611 stop:5735 length:1125 start_codon:yes stop_codon:yes gene_type:complete
MAAAAAATAATTTAGENDDDGPPGNTNLRDSSGAPNWNAILKWSVEEGLRQEAELKAKGVAEGGRPKPRTISEEDREWFLKAIESGVVDEVKRIKEITEKISDDPRGDLLATEEEEDERVFVLEELRDRLESVDNAKDLGAIGGLTPLLEGIQSEKWEEIRAMSAECVAVSVQNHPEAQKNAMSCDALRVLLLALQSEKHLNKKSNAKVIYALSCLVRGNQEVMGMFVKSDGIESLAKSGLASSVIKTRVKAATLLRHASVSSEEAMKRTIDAKVIDIIAEKLGANVNSQNASSSSLTDLAQEREAYIRLLLDVAQRVDFMKNEDAVNQFRSERFVQTVQNCQTFVDASKKNRDKMIDEEEFIVAVDRLRNMLK